VRGGGLRVVQVRCIKCGAYVADAWVGAHERGNVLWDICVLCRRRGGWR
jgi:DNA-directed RNA polymerase subunit N (RpoN/RPB10)